MKLFAPTAQRAIALLVCLGWLASMFGVVQANPWPVRLTAAACLMPLYLTARPVFLPVVEISPTRTLVRSNMKTLRLLTSGDWEPVIVMRPIWAYLGVRRDADDTRGFTSYYGVSLKRALVIERLVRDVEAARSAARAIATATDATHLTGREKPC